MQTLNNSIESLKKFIDEMQLVCIKEKNPKHASFFKYFEANATEMLAKLNAFINVEKNYYKETKK